MNAKEWIAEIESARKREKEFRKRGRNVNKIYGAEIAVKFNIVFSNTETMLPSLYSTIPRPVVERRFKDSDPLGKAAALAGQRGLEFLVDTNVEGYETYDEAVRSAVLDALLPGRGVTSVTYDADIVGEENTKQADQEAASGDPDAEESVPYKASELVCCEAQKWDHFLMGYATK